MKSAQRVFALIVLAYAVSSGSLPMWMRVTLGLLSVACVLQTRREKTAPREDQVLALAMAGVLSLGAVQYPYALANHHFVMIYASLAFAVSAHSEGPEARRRLQLVVARLLAALMAVAAMQKLASPSYIDGGFFAHLFDTGSLGGPLMGVCAGCMELIDANTHSIITFVRGPPVLGETLELASILGGDSALALTLGRALALLIVVYELWLACVFALAPRHHVGPACVLFFVTGLALFRAEWIFGGLLCAMAYAACGAQFPRLRVGLLVAAGVFVTLALLG